MIDILQKTRQPFNVNGLAMAGGAGGPGRRGTPAAHQGRHGRGAGVPPRARFAGLGLEYVPSHANFVLVNVGDGKLVFEQLLQKGIIVRAMNSYKLPAWVRVSVGTMEENRRFVDALAEVMKTH